MAVTAQDTYDIFIGSGALAYSWYQNITEGEPTEADPWTVTFTRDGGDGPEGEHTISHKTVMRAVRRIASKDGAEIRFLAKDVRKECQALVFKGPEEVDFDSDKADQVLQVAAFGEVVYG